MTLALGFVVLAVVGGGLFLNTLLAAVAAEPASGPSRPGSEVPGAGSQQNRPSTGVSPVRAATANPLYQAGPLVGSHCVGRRIIQGNSASFEAFLNSTSDCLDRAWAVAFRTAGLRFQPPERVFWSSPGRSPCGDYPAPGVAAFYCSFNNSIYIGVSGHAVQSAGNLPVIYNVAYARNLAHEYAHHVQESSGILEYARQERQSAASVYDRNAITRRSELQAQCFAGVFMFSVRESFPVTSRQWQITLRDSYGRGDDPSRPQERDHGTGRHYAAWLNRGYSRGSTGVCNTWIASVDQVS